VDQQFDNLGRVSRTSDPYFAGSTDIVWSAVQYDAISRPTRLIAPGNRTTSVAYAGRQVTSTNAVGQSRTERVNAKGELITVVDNLGGVLSYQYDAIGNLIKTIDVEGNVTRIEYDDRGNETLLDDPNLGTRRYSYNVFGEVIAEVDAKQQIRRYDYDQLGRLVRQREPEGVSTWQYDTAPNGIGLLNKVTGPRGYQYLLSYDSLSRLKTTTLTPETGSASYTISNEYDSLSRLKKLVYPSGFSVQYVYNGYGYLKQITADDHATPVWQADQVNARGQLMQQTLGNGAVTAYSYDGTTGYLRGISTPGIQNLTYDYNDIGSLTRRSDVLQNISETFQYDGLERLKRADVFHGTTQASAVNVAYSATGRISFKSDVGNYNYGTSGAARPDAVQSILSATGAVLHQYGYDANGNRIAKDGDATAYSSQDLPVSIRSGNNRIDFSYSPSGDRTRQRVYNAGALESVKTYVGGIYEVEESGGKITQTHYISAPTGMVAIYEVVNGINKSTKYLHQDELGSVQAISDESGHVSETLSFDAWGQRRDATTWLPGMTVDSETSRGFTGHEQLDEVGLVHMNGRVYDPQIGRFLSADSFVQDPLNSQSYDRYSYVINNPVSRTDPSGYLHIGGSIGNFIPNEIKDAVPDEIGDAANGIADGASKLVPEEIKGIDPAATAQQAVGNVVGALIQGDFKAAAQAAVQGAVDYYIDVAAVTFIAATAGESGGTSAFVGAYIDRALKSAANAAISGLFGNNDSTTAPSTHGTPTTPYPRPDGNLTDGSRPRPADVLEGSVFNKPSRPRLDEGAVESALIQPADLAGAWLGGKLASLFGNGVRIATPYGVAVQDMSEAALQARVEIQNGARLFKGGTLGRSETGASQFLSREYPLNPNYASRYGVPSENANFDFVLMGRVREGAAAVTRPSPGIFPNAGGGIEAVVNPGDFIIDSFHMP
jgi:RHS repeat-associated protein